VFSVVREPLLGKLPVRSADQKLAKGEVGARLRILGAYKPPQPPRAGVMHLIAAGVLAVV